MVPVSKSHKYEVCLPSFMPLFVPGWKCCGQVRKSCEGTVQPRPRLLCFAVSKIWTDLAFSSWCGRVKKRQITVPPLTDICEEAVFVFVFADICEEGGGGLLWQEGNYMEEIFWSWGGDWTLTGGSSFPSVDPHTCRHLDISTHWHVEASSYHGIPLGYRSCYDISISWHPIRISIWCRCFNWVKHVTQRPSHFNVGA